MKWNPSSSLHQNSAKAQLNDWPEQSPWGILEGQKPLLVFRDRALPIIPPSFFSYQGHMDG